jgi:hypothetical protein
LIFEFVGNDLDNYSHKEIINEGIQLLGNYASKPLANYIRLMNEKINALKDKESLDELKKEIISLKEIVLELQAEVNVLRNETIKSNAKLDKVAKGSIPVWFKRLVFVLMIITLFFMIYVPLAYYYPTAPVISQINFVFDKIPFFGGSTFLEFLLRFFQRLFGVL